MRSPRQRGVRRPRQQANIDRAFFDWWFDKTTNVPAIFGDAHAAAVTKAWEIGKGMGIIPAVPDVKPMIWEHALKA